MYCKHCGNHVRDDARYCPNCGASTFDTPYQSYQPQPHPQYQVQNQAPAQKTENTIAIVGFVLSFIVPLAGLICSIVGLKNAKKGAPYKGLAIAGIVISAVWMFISFIYFMVLINALVRGTFYSFFYLFASLFS